MTVEFAEQQPVLHNLRLSRWDGYAPVAWAFLISRAAFVLGAILGSLAIPEATGEPARVEMAGPRVLSALWHWDAVHYYTIAVDGYAWPGLTAFFPLFPLLIRAIAWLLSLGQTLPSWSILAAGILISQVATLVGLAVVYTFIRERANRGVATRAVLLIALFPFAFIYVTPHTEALFLALSAAALLLAHRGQWLGAGLCASLAGATRPVGILIAPALVAEALTRRRLLDARVVAGLALAPLGFLGYAGYLWWRFGDPLLFAEVQRTEWRREVLFPLQTLYRGIRYALHPEWSENLSIWARGILHLIVVIGALMLTALWWRRWSVAERIYVLFTLIAVLWTPLGGGWTMHGMGRYLAVLFPLYQPIAAWTSSPRAQVAVLSAWIPLFALFSALYVQWYAA